jgi:hypothetical protein
MDMSGCDVVMAWRKAFVQFLSVYINTSFLLLLDYIYIYYEYIIYC